MKSLAAVVGRNSDTVVIALVMGVLLALFAPVPAPLLDFLILLNITIALLVLLMTFYAPRPVDFSTFPALLLIATLFRLALNVSATRLILSQAAAGRVIAAVGAFVVGGNYVIGLIIFLILVVVQYVVVTSGAQRVSEVAARFTLDSIPGQQMSIDADLNMGFIDQEEAKRRRKVLEREAAFYGAMDGASTSAPRTRASWRDRCSHCSRSSRSRDLIRGSPSRSLRSCLISRRDMRRRRR